MPAAPLHRPTDRRDAPTRRRRRVALPVAGVVLLVVAGMAAWYGWSLRPVRHVALAGNSVVPRAELLHTAGLDTVQQMATVDQERVVALLQAHPWIARAEVASMITGGLAVEVQERVPVALELDRRGEPLHYLDSTGAVLPRRPGAAFDVPLLRRTARTATGADSTALRALLITLATAPEGARPLISELELRAGGDLWLTAVPADGRPAVPVRLGREGYTEKLERLAAFWQQAFLPQPENTFRLVDLRFDGQVVTQEFSAADTVAAPEPAPPVADAQEEMR